MQDYEHTQAGWLIRIWVGLWAVIFGGAAIFVLSTGYERSAGLVFLAIGAILALLLALFHGLTVRVSVERVLVSFGVGLIKKSIPVERIQGAAAVRNRWYHGWGIRRIWGGWLFNVSGFDAVELQLENGRFFRVGTDEPRELLAAVERVLEARR